jgi:hypothetical protein
MKLRSLTLMAITTLLLSGCGSSVPTCSDAESTDLVSEIADQEMGKQLGIEMAKTFSYIVNSIRTTATNEQTGSHECAAELEVKGPNGSNSIPITYSIEMTDNGEEFYINVFGL